MAKTKVKELTETKNSDNGMLEKSTLKDKIVQMENEIKQVEAEFHKRAGKLELLKEMLIESQLIGDHSVCFFLCVPSP